MSLIAMLSVFAHLLVIQRGIRYFRQKGSCRESDKSIVATLMFLSVAYVVVLVMSWPEMPWNIMRQTLGIAMMQGFTFANSFFYLGLITALTERRQWHFAEGRPAVPRRTY